MYLVMKEKVEACFERLENPFTILNSEYKRSKCMTDKWEIVEPVECVIDTRRNKKTGTYDQVVVQDKFVYIPILSTVHCSQYLKVNMLQKCCKAQLPATLDIDICDGSFFKSLPLFSTEKQTIQIQMFYDDFEVANPLGPKQGIYKLGGVYFTLRNFSPKWNSLSANIHLCALFHTQDVKRYGFSEIFAPIVRDIKVLESDGIEIPLYNGYVRGTVL